jgi:hypothetical protein
MVEGGKEEASRSDNGAPNDVENWRERGLERVVKITGQSSVDGT